ncbi:MAG: NADP-specific glutamate dehydrogenase [Candidatus Bruticola sp.]
MGMRTTTLDLIMGQVAVRNPGEPEFLQAVREVFSSVVPVVEANPVYRRMKVLERLVEPERVIIFRVPWIDDLGNVQINRGYRVEMCGAIGPFQGGLRFHPSVNLSIIKFLAFEQVFRNALTCLPLGGAKGGADFDPKGKSDMEVMRFCQSFMSELFRHIGPTVDVATSGLGVSGREIGYLFGMYKKLSGQFSGALTNKGLGWGGSMLRPEATGFGVIYFIENMLNRRRESLEGKRIVLSGSGNVAQFAAKKAIAMGAKVLTMSDSSGMIYDPEGIDEDKLDWIMELKNLRRGRIREYVDEFGDAEYIEGGTPWNIPCDVAIPAATQNEIFLEDAQTLISNGVTAVAEAADMPCMPEAVSEFLRHKILFGPSKAVNAGGVATSGLEMSQNASHESWSIDEIDRRLRRIIYDIHEACVCYGRSGSNFVNYVRGANVAGFVKVADAMVDQGVV